MPHLVAHFPDQASAMSALARLESRGLAPGQALPATDASVGRTRTSADVPSNPPSSVSHQGNREPRNTSATAEPSRGMSGRGSTPEHPEELGRAQLLVNLDGQASADELSRMLSDVGAVDITRSDADFPTETAGVWPDAPRGNAVDVQRAIAASREGAAAGAPPKEDINRPSMKTRHDPQR
jgi:hypothetical protein